MAKLNKEGLTYNEWTAAAGYSKEEIREKSAMCKRAWAAGEDPTEHRAERSHQKNPETGTAVAVGAVALGIGLVGTLLLWPSPAGAKGPPKGGTTPPKGGGPIITPNEDPPKGDPPIVVVVPPPEPKNEPGTGNAFIRKGERVLFAIGPFGLPDAGSTQADPQFAEKLLADLVALAGTTGNAAQGIAMPSAEAAARQQFAIELSDSGSIDLVDVVVNVAAVPTATLWGSNGKVKIAEIVEDPPVPNYSALRAQGAPIIGIAVADAEEDPLVEIWRQLTQASGPDNAL